MSSKPTDGPALRIYRWAYDRSVTVEPEIVAEVRDTPKNREALRTGGPHAFRSSEYTQDIAVYAFPDREHARTARVEHRNGGWVERHGERILSGSTAGNVDVWNGGSYAKQMRPIAPTPMEVMQSVSAALYAAGEESTSRWMWSHVSQILPMMQPIAEAVARKHGGSIPQVTALTVHRGGGGQAPARPEFRGYTVFVGHVPLDEIPRHLRPQEHVGGMQGIEVDSPAAAVRVVEHFRDATGMGGSAAPRGFGNVVKWPEGQVIGKVSYNGRYWVPRTPAPVGDPLFLIDRRMDDLVEQAPPAGSFDAAVVDVMPDAKATKQWITRHIAEVWPGQRVQSIRTKEGASGQRFFFVSLLGADPGYSRHNTAADIVAFRGRLRKALREFSGDEWDDAHLEFNAAASAPTIPLPTVDDLPTPDRNLWAAHGQTFMEKARSDIYAEKKKKKPGSNVWEREAVLDLMVDALGRLEEERFKALMMQYRDLTDASARKRR